MFKVHAGCAAIHTFGAGEDVVPSNHDYFLITCHGVDRYVVDLTTAQLGRDEWLYTQNEHEKSLLTWRLDPKPVKVEEKIRELDEGDFRVGLAKGAVEKRYVEEAEARESGGEDNEVVYGDLVNQVRKEVLAALLRRVGGDDEGYESLDNNEEV
jgi:hypothetical protein